MELQLKGGGPTPFCRGADGSAVLRSSVREFLASEAMFALGVPTTRALSLIASSQDAIARPWYSNSSPTTSTRKHGGDVMVSNRRAITTRVATSFLRVGQFELYGRRAARGEAQGVRELAMLARHALAREYPDIPVPPPLPEGGGVDETPHLLALQPSLLAMVRAASLRMATLMSHWLRVGYTQSNFNADNCLVGGVTMDYGPFGFMERYSGEWSMWVGSGPHYAFANQPSAGYRNLGQFAKSLAPLLDREGVVELQAIMDGHVEVSAGVVGEMWGRKMGFQPTYSRAHPQVTGKLYHALEALMSDHPTDYTILFRQLAGVLGGEGEKEGGGSEPWESVCLGGDSDEGGGGGGGGVGMELRRNLLDALGPAFYDPALPPPLQKAWKQWGGEWVAALRASGTTPSQARATMNSNNPKYIPREWLLVEAYTAAERGEHGPLLELHRVLKRPYDEQPEAAQHYYSKAPPGVERMGGVGFMS